MARAEREGHKYLRRELRPNGTYRYIYEEPAVTTGTTNVIGDTPTTRKTGDWVASYYKTMNAVSTSNLVTDANVSRGKKRASKKVRTVKQLRERQRTKEDYDKMINDVKTEVETKTKQNEEYYKNLLNDEVEAYKAKQIKKLESQYGSEVPKEVLDKVEQDFKSFSDQLWKDTYEPMVKKINESIKANGSSVSAQLLRIRNQLD